MNWYLKVLKQYADFEGRARRKELWMFILCHIIVSVSLLAVGGFVGQLLADAAYGGIFLLIPYTLATIIPSLAVRVRRLHDIGESGWMYLVSFIPLIGGIWLFVLLVTDGNIGENKYGEDPKEFDI